jgi:hypothetical protein
MSRIVDVRLVRDRDGVWRVSSADARVVFASDNSGRVAVVIDTSAEPRGVAVYAKVEEYT